MDMALKWSSPIAAGRTESLEHGKTYFAVTFDDALQCVAENALPELRRREIPSTIFAVTESLDQFPTWIKDEYRGSTAGKVMSAQQLKNSMSSLVAIGSHTLTHPKLCNVSEIEARRQIAESRTALEVVLHTPVTLFSFPYGAFDENLVRWCREARYERVFTTLPIPALSDSKEFICGRVVVEPTDWPLDFFLKIQGAYSWLPLAFSLKRKLKQAFQIRNRNHRKMKTQIESDS